jgi:hypothetical protein
MVHLNFNKLVMYFSVACRVSIVYVAKLLSVENKYRHTYFLVHTKNVLCCFSVEGLKVACSFESFGFVTPRLRSWPRHRCSAILIGISSGFLVAGEAAISVKVS